MRRPWQILLLLLTMLGAGLSAFGDGKMFTPPGFLRAETPSQRALLHWRDGIETLVIETTTSCDP